MWNQSALLLADISCISPGLHMSPPTRRYGFWSPLMDPNQNSDRRSPMIILQKLLLGLVAGGLG